MLKLVTPERWEYGCVTRFLFKVVKDGLERLKKLLKHPVGKWGGTSGLRVPGRDVRLKARGLWEASGACCEAGSYFTPRVSSYKLKASSPSAPTTADVFFGLWAHNYHVRVTVKQLKF